jgi:hypothetical protein
LLFWRFAHPLHARTRTAAAAGRIDRKVTTSHWCHDSPARAIPASMKIGLPFIDAI